MVWPGPETPKVLPLRKSRGITICLHVGLNTRGGNVHHFCASIKFFPQHESKQAYLPSVALLMFKFVPMTEGTAALLQPMCLFVSGEHRQPEAPSPGTLGRGSKGLRSLFLYNLGTAGQNQAP